jgi:hypothetical protein
VEKRKAGVGARAVFDAALEPERGTKTDEDEEEREGEKGDRRR